MSDSIADSLRRLARDDSGRVLATLAKRFNDLDLADEAVQEALIEASQRWADDGVPDNPSGWLYRVASRKAIDRLRRVGAEQRRLDRAAPDLLADMDEPDDTDRASLIDESDETDIDERLRLMLLCCHPALNPDAQVALTLRLVAGLTTEEIAAAFLVPTPTLAARVTRAKKKIRAANIPLSVPDELDVRLDAVLTMLYLVFNEGYLSRGTHAETIRADLCDEALRLSTLVCDLVPESAEARGLLALMLLTHARRDARLADGTITLLDDQDRSRWRLDEIRAGNAALAEAMRLMRPGAFQIQALIASHHSNAATPADTNWPDIVRLYDQLIAMRSSPVVALNRAVSIAMADGPLAGLVELDAITGLDDYHLFHSARAELLVRAGRPDEAAQSFETARDLASNPGELEHLVTRLAQLQ